LSLLYGNVEELSTDDFEKIDNDGEFLVYCGLYTLNYGKKARKSKFLMLSQICSLILIFSNYKDHCISFPMILSHFLYIFHEIYELLLQF
jgi:hypothetical protein